MFCYCRPFQSLLDSSTTLRLLGLVLHSATTATTASTTTTTTATTASTTTIYYYYYSSYYSYYYYFYYYYFYFYYYQHHHYYCHDDNEDNDYYYSYFNYHYDYDYCYECCQWFLWRGFYSYSLNCLLGGVAVGIFHDHNVETGATILLGTDGSGGPFSDDPRLRKSAWAVVALRIDGDEFVVIGTMSGALLDSDVMKLAILSLELNLWLW